jgi:hypothetical protein
VRASALCVLAWAFASGCTVNANDSNATQCRIDSNVLCTGNFVGYSCQGDRQPSLDCGAGTVEADGETGYCCGVGATSQCVVDDLAGCGDGSTGYSCTNGVLPSATDPSLSCGAGVTGNDGDELYCCIAGTASSCARDMTVAGCTGGSLGYSCTSIDTPTQSNPLLDCSTPTPGVDGSSLYCCIGFSSTAGSCAPDASVAGCAANSYGFSCTSTDTPDQTQPALVCSTATQGPNGELLYCCSST